MTPDIFNRLWPSRPKATWVAQCIPTPPSSDIHRTLETDANNAWRKDRLRWSNGTTMKVGDWYELYFEKPRALSEITARSQGERFPQKVRFLVKEHRNDEWVMEVEETITLGQNDRNTIFHYRFGKHRRVGAIRFEIIEPTLKPLRADGRSPAWAIYNLDFKEYRLWGCLWECPIK